MFASGRLSEFLGPKTLTADKSNNFYFIKNLLLIILLFTL